MKIIPTPVRAILLATMLGAVVTPVFAQPADSTPAERAAMDRAVVDRDRDDNGFPWGLLGLVGLLGLMPRKQHVVNDPNRSHVNANPNAR